MLNESTFIKDFLGDTSCLFRFNGFQVSVVNYTKKVSENWHYHENIHLSAILKGGNLESRKRNDIQVHSGSIMTYDQGELHRNRFTAHPSRNLNIEFNDEFFDDQIRFSNFNATEISINDFIKLYVELNLNDNLTTESIEYFVKSLFWNNYERDTCRWIHQLKALLNDRWNEFVSLEELSGELRIHPVTISKNFAKHTGITLSEYMRKIKVKRALEMLCNSSKSFAEIAFACGFSDQSHMNRIVKNDIGFTPGEIRNVS